MHKEKDKLGMIMAVYLLGLFIGALNTGTITPVRTIIQNDLGVNSQDGIWMITIYTLFYAAIIPISGKLADRLGRKSVFLISILLFGVGSVICGISAGADSFALLLIGRVVQAVGAGGIMPVATAEFGTSFPPEKRGMALGLVGGVFGIANVLGATVGSAILDIFGSDNWEWIFYINVPFCILVIAGGIVYIPNHKSENVFKIDKIGTLLMTVIILALLYGLKNIDFFDFIDSLMQKDVYPYLLVSAVLIPVFVFVEKRAEDPIFHIEYMKNSQIVVTLIMGMLVGCSMMGMIFIPQFAENALKVTTGDGGYFVIILGLFAGAASPVSGKYIDKFGSKPVLGAGFVISILGALYLAFVATVHINLVNVIISLVLIGLGLGISIGTPLNYMMMRHTTDEESNSALATLSLVRSIGTAIAPAIMVGFIAQAGAGMQADLMEAMPEIPEMPKMEQQVELEAIVDRLGENEEFKEMMGDMDIKEMLSMDMSMDTDAMTSDSDMELPDELLDELQNSDVTTVTAACKDMATYMFDANTADVITEIQDGIQEGIDGIDDGIEGISSGISEMQSGYDEMMAGRDELSEGIDGVSQGISGMESGVSKQEQGIAGIKKGIAGMETAIAEQDKAIAGIKQGITGMKSAIAEQNEGIAGIEQGIAGMESAIAEQEQGIAGLEKAIEAAEARHASDAEINQLKAQLAQLKAARDEVAKKLETTQGQLKELVAARDAVAKKLEMTKGQLKELQSARAAVAGKLKTARAQLKELQSAKDTLSSKIDDTKDKKASMEDAYDEMTSGSKELKDAISETEDQKELMVKARALMVEMKDGIPGLFEQAKEDYLKAIDDNSEKIEAVYQKDLNVGFKNMFICVAIFNIIGFILLMFYRDDRIKREDEIV